MMKLNRRLLEEKQKKQNKKKNKKGKSVKTSNNDKNKKKRKLTVIDSDHHQDEAGIKYKGDDIFGVAYDTLIDLSIYKPRIRVRGLSPLDAGKNSLISSSMYNQIKTMINIEKSQKTSSRKLNDEPRSLFGSGENLMKVILLSFALLM